jgi:hypothetical protein
VLEVSIVLREFPATAGVAETRLTMRFRCDASPRREAANRILIHQRSFTNAALRDRRF